MLRLVHYGNALPTSMICDPSAEFQAGQVATVTVIGNQVMATVSDGTCPIGIIDDMRTRSFTKIAWNEVKVEPVSGVLDLNGQLVTPADIKIELDHPNITASSFVSNVRVVLNNVNGVITVPAGTPLNLDIDGDSVYDAIRVIVNYTYQVPDIPGDDSTEGSGRITIWYERMMFETDQFESNVSYPVRANLFVSETGLFTTRRPSKYHPAIGIVISPPSIISPYLQALWL